ncbi:MAG: histidinol-phosphatase [Bacillaceae bacterium]
MYTDYHTHLEKGTLTLEYLEEFTNEAKKKGIAHLGISEHAYHFYQTKDIVSKPWMEARRYYDMNDYVALFHQAWNKGIDVKMSIEMDYTPESHEEMKRFINQYDFDYVIGSVHWNGDFPIDLDKRDWEGKDLYDIYTRYYNQIVTLAQSNLFDIVGHVDLVKIFKYIPADEAFLLQQYERITDALAQSKTCVEISTAGLRKMVGEIYPDPRLLKMCYQKGIPIVMSSDAHLPQEVGHRYEEARKLILETGYTSLMTFNKGERKEISILP